MNYTLTKPCDNCPFRRTGGIRLTRGRVLEIASAEGSFPCHKTTVDDGDGERVETARSLHCAGFLIFQEKRGRANQMMRIAERIGLYDARQFVDSPHAADVFDSVAEMIRANRVPGGAT